MASEPNEHTFQKTLQLIPNCYIFYCLNSKFPIFQTRCGYLVNYILLNLDCFTLIDWNVFMTEDESQFEKLPVFVKEYYSRTGNRCIPWEE